jgi:hypothetical protein
MSFKDIVKNKIKKINASSIGTNIVQVEVIFDFLFYDYKKINNNEYLKIINKE